MNLDSIKKQITRRPFEPFRVVMSSGQTYDVRHPDAAMMLRDALVVAYGGNGGPPEFAATLSLLHITAIEPLTGSRRKRAGTGH